MERILHRPVPISLVFEAVEFEKIKSLATFGPAVTVPERVYCSPTQ